MAILNSVSFSKINPTLDCVICQEGLKQQENTYQNSSYLDLAAEPKYVVHNHSYSQKFEAHEDAYRRLSGLDLATEPKYIISKNSWKTPLSNQAFEMHQEAYNRLAGLDLATQPKNIIQKKAKNAVHISCHNKWILQKKDDGLPLNCAHCNERVHSFDGKKHNLPVGNEEIVPAPAFLFQELFERRWGVGPFVNAMMVNKPERYRPEIIRIAQWRWEVGRDIINHPERAEEILFTDNAMIVFGPDGNDYSFVSISENRNSPEEIAVSMSGSLLGRIIPPIGNFIIRDGDPRQFQQLLEEAHLSRGIRSLAVLFATQLGRTELVRALLLNGPIQPILLNKAIKVALRKGYLRIAQMLWATQQRRVNCSTLLTMAVGAVSIAASYILAQRLSQQ